MTILNDLDVSEPTAAEVSTARDLSRRLDQLARDVEVVAGRFSDDAGLVVRGARERMASARGDLDRAALDAAVSAAALADQRSAGDAWLRDAPKRMDFESATAEVDAARLALMDAANAGLPTAAADARLRAAQQQLRELKDRRAAADRDYESACQRAQSRLGRHGKCKPSSDPRILDSGSADAPGGTTPPRSTPPTPAPSPMPGPPTRISSGTPPPAAPAPVPLTATPTVPANAAVPAPPASAPQAAPMPPMPQVTPSAPAAAPRRDTDRPALDSP